MNKTEENRRVRREMRLQFIIAAFISFAVLALLSGAVLLTYKMLPSPEKTVLAPEAEELIGQVEDIFVQDGGTSELLEMQAAYEALSDETKAQVPKACYDKIQEAISLAEWVGKEGNGITVKDKSRNGYEIPFDTGSAKLRRRDGRIVFEGEADVEGKDAQETFRQVFDGDGSFTIEAVVNPNGWGYGSGDFNVIVSKGDSCTSLRISGQKAYFFIRNTEGAWITAEKNLTREQMNSWIHIAGIYNGADVSVYVEGSELVTTRNAGICMASDYPFSIGYCPETGRISTVSIQKLHVYEQALTKTELDQGGYGPDSENVVLWYDFDDYSYIGIDTESKGIRSYLDTVKLAQGESASLQAELVPYYAEGKIVYSSDKEAVASVSEDGIVTGEKEGTALVTAMVEGTDFSVTIPVTVDDFAQRLWKGLDWIVQRLWFLDVGIFLLLLFIIAFVQRRKLLGYLTEVSEAVSMIGQHTGSLELSPALIETQEKIREVEEDFRKRDFAAREAEQKKNDLVVYLAHDLKTPIASIMGYLTLLRDEKQISPDIYQHYVETIMKNTERLDDLVSEFFEITRFNLSHITLNYRDINLTWMLEQMVFEFRPMLQEKGLDCRLDVPKNVRLRCDGDKMERVFDNLLRNAISYCFPDTTIDISVVLEERIVIAVTNQGETIPEEKLLRIFEQFYRIDYARSSGTGGSGLGLAIAKQIVELHGGEILAESRENTIRITVKVPFSEKGKTDGKLCI